MTNEAFIYASDVVERLALVGEFDATKWAATFCATYREIPEIAGDEETMLAWFASAIMAGYDWGRTLVPDEVGDGSHEAPWNTAALIRWAKKCRAALGDTT